MKRIGIVSTAALSLLLGIAIPAYAQDEKQDKPEDKKEQPAKAEEKRAPEAKPAQQEEKRSREAKPAQQEEKRAQEAKPKQEEKRVQEEKPTQERTAQQEQHNQPAHRAGGGRIPDDRFRANFGREHSFRVSEGDYRNRRFQYGGYWFGFAGVWPSNWLYTQNVFVVDIDGVYYLCNANYPGVNIEISVTL